MGFPDQLKNLTFREHQALMAMVSEAEREVIDESKKLMVNEATQQNGAPGASQQESHNNLNADLLMQNIYRSEEFFEMTGHLSVQEYGIQSEERGRETDVKQHRELTVINSNNQTLKKQLDTNSDLDVDQELQGNIEEDLLGESGALKGPGQSNSPDVSVGGISNREASSQTKNYQNKKLGRNTRNSP